MIIAWTLPEARFLSIRKCMDKGRVYTIQRGSFVWHKRKQLDHLALRILRPWFRPLAPMAQAIPVATDADIEAYFVHQFINPEVPENAAYSYGNRVAPHLEYAARILRETPDTNQVFISVAQPDDVHLAHPPCLLSLSWKVTEVGLQLTSFWRSWDLYAGFAIDMGGLQLLNEMMAEWAELEPGHLIAYSDGAHLYDYSWELV